MRNFVAICLIGLLSLCPFAAFAEETSGAASSHEASAKETTPIPSLNEPSKRTATPAPVVGSSAFFVEVMAGLAFVLLCIFALAWLVRRTGQGSFLANKQMSVVASMALGTRERAVVIEVGGQQILLGVTPQHINTLHVFDEPVISQAKPGEVLDFSEKMKHFMNKGQKV